MKSHHHAHVPFNGVRHDGANMYPHLAVFYTHLDFFWGGNSLPPFRPLSSVPSLPSGRRKMRDMKIRDGQKCRGGKCET